MEYKKIENLIYNNSLIKKDNYKTQRDYEIKLDSMLIDNLNRCIEKKIPLNMDEKDVINIYKTFLRLNKNNYDIDISFIKNIINLSEKKLDFYEIINGITK